MATRPTLPYVAPDEILPSPLPSVEEILASPCLFDGVFRRVGHHFMVKHGKSTGALLQEGQNMLFVEQSASLLRIPKNYAISSHEKTNMDFIVMEYIPGKLLDRIDWCTLTVSQKTNITSQLRRGLDELRSIPSPEQWIDAMWRCAVGVKSATDSKLPNISRLRKDYHLVFKGYKPVFTHADLGPGHVVLRNVVSL
ncbi:hypothetical protein CHGG_03539 [Chaetomium globosum CBS 148.51]|uniref:Aminoglycoside phosphotransferase domain-containing protein n=1 Tax=Chaetomium globosum (strain ATCC 6205 / CBS 148.51 / DSM 1962 / NBRC 6347 / NRRL 1970) TaxID=306901 RepID=Q2H8B5_CHAGB|nr:uncharacterized protein CHGG_03539 [Chaetomium globosum CBS 148.51]EAQ91604.1 hypothetical protein CHGG_03539 [Chaetomium globosum CBS 148.51]